MALKPHALLSPLCLARVTFSLNLYYSAGYNVCPNPKKHQFNSKVHGKEGGEGGGGKRQSIKVNVNPAIKGISLMQAFFACATVDQQSGSIPLQYSLHSLLA